MFSKEAKLEQIWLPRYSEQDEKVMTPVFAQDKVVLVTATPFEV